ncbi:lipocalin family protein [Flammeovirga sp. OC4]|uniref:lipocalin family protein n=1 Tax=Flammeovirga sp. OC4 TaxID=1382345 RepID=UPI0005C5AB2C|nr:lipocalin family protein [Flammeovirga sp. OC4]
MKKINSIFCLFIFACLFSSCTDDAENSIDSALLVGEWKNTFQEVRTTTTVMDSDMAVDTESLNAYENINITTRFNSDKTMEVVGTTDIINRTYFEGLNGELDSIDFNLTNVAIDQTGTWSLNGNQLTLSNESAAAQALDVTSLTENELILDFNLSQEVTSSGITQKVTAQGRIKYSRE